MKIYLDDKTEKMKNGILSKEDLEQIKIILYIFAIIGVYITLRGVLE